MIESLEGILRKNHLGSLRRGGFGVTAKKADSPRGAWGLVREFAPEQGWACLTDRVAVLNTSNELAALETGIPLSGEFLSGVRSLHLRQGGEGWEAWIIERHEAGDDLWYAEDFIGTSAAGGRKLRYEIFWRREPDGAYRPAASRFAGFAGGEGEQ